MSLLLHSPQVGEIMILMSDGHGDAEGWLAEETDDSMEQSPTASQTSQSAPVVPLAAGPAGAQAGTPTESMPGPQHSAAVATVALNSASIPWPDSPAVLHSFQLPGRLCRTEPSTCRLLAMRLCATTCKKMG